MSPPAKIGQNNNIINGLDYIRFFAAWLVAIFHMAYFSWTVPMGYAAKASGGAFYMPSMKDFTWFGWIGVEIFFVLSGLVISLSAQDATLRSFLKGRFLRLYPGVLICGILTCLLIWESDAFPDARQRLVNTLILNPFGPWVDGVYWTLFVEIGFYGLVLGMIAIGATARMELLAAGLIAYGNFYMAVWLHDSALAKQIDLLGLGRYGCFFAIGLVIFLTRFRARNRIAPVILVIAALPPCAFRIIEKSWELAQGDLMALWPPFFVWGVAVVLIYASTHDRWGMSRLPAIRTLGLTTYPFYLLHDVFGLRLGAWLLKYVGSQFVALTISAMITFALSLAIARYAEPFLRLRLAHWFVLRIGLKDAEAWLAKADFRSGSGEKPAQSLPILSRRS